MPQPNPVEQVVLLDDDGRAIGAADKRTVHGATTPRHLGFSCYGFDGEGRVLLTRRSRQKLTFPLVWTNTCCGHPAPGEDPGTAVARRLAAELGLVPRDLRLVLPDFSYRASDGGPDGGVEENELCPVYVCALDADPDPHPGEADAWEWWEWPEFLRRAAAGELSPWARLQAPQLAASADPVAGVR